MNYQSFYNDYYDDGNYEEPTIIGIAVIDSSGKNFKTQPYYEVMFQPHENVSYRNLIRKIRQYVPDLNENDDYMTFVDDRGSFYSVYDNHSFNESLDNCEGNYNLYIVFNHEIENSSGNPCYSQYFCNVCCLALKRFRWHCTICPHDYDLCGACKENNMHMCHSNGLQYFDVFPSLESPYLEIQQMNYYDLVSKIKIGEGSFGTVYSAHSYSLNQKVAVKFLKNPYQVNNFVREMEVLEEVGEHDNLVKILGFVISNNQMEMGIVMECITMKIDNYKEISGLSTYFAHLRNKLQRNERVNSWELGSFALQIARGMEHLELMNIMHRDLAARNILIDSYKNVKISDFGVSRLGDYYEANNIFAVRWAAPEVLQDNFYSHRSDSWAFGVVLWEIATLGGLPYVDFSNDQVVDFILEGNGHLYKPRNMSDRLFKIMERCWARRPDNRPNFSTLVEKLLDFKWLGPPYLDFSTMGDDFALPLTLRLYNERLRGI